MNSFASRTIIVSMIAAALVVPLYAHHGTQFLSRAMEMNRAEVHLGEMAMTKAQDSRVKDLAQMLAGLGQDQAMFEAQSRVHWNAARGNKQTGSATAGREKPRAPAQKYSRSDLARDVDTAEFAGDTLPTLRQHLQRAEEIQRTMK